MKGCIKILTLTFVYPIMLLGSIIPLFISCEKPSDEEEIIQEAIAVFHPISLSKLQDSTQRYPTYNVTFTDTLGIAQLKDFGDRISLEIHFSYDKPNTSSAIHMHEGAINKPERHWNRQGTLNFCEVVNLGEAWGRPNLGDLGNLHFNNDGIANFYLETDLWSLNSTAPNDIMGSLIVIHFLYEDFDIHCNSSPHNHIHYNPKIAIGIIELSSNN